MEMVACALASAVMEGEDPRKFFKRISAKKREDDANKPAVHRVHTHPEPCAEWAEWEDLEEWMRVAAREMEIALATEFELNRHETLSFSIDSDDAHSYTVYENNDVAELEAIESVKNQLEDEPGNFTQSWLEGFINLDRLRRDYWQDARDDNYWDDEFGDYEAKLDELIKRDLIDDDPRDETDGEITPEIESLVDEKWEEMIEEHAREQLKDPIEWLENFYTHEEAIKKAIETAGFDIEAAARDAVASDGWQHFLAHYDFNSYDLPSGAVYVRT